jgi:hypothetical protein
MLFLALGATKDEGTGSAVTFFLMVSVLIFIDLIHKKRR